jgi:hypothetical protein
MTTLRTKVNNSVLGYISNLSAGETLSTTLTVGGTTAGAAEFKGITSVSNATDATSPILAAFKVSGGIATELQLRTGGNAWIGDVAAGTGVATVRKLTVSNILNDASAQAQVISKCDRTEIRMGATSQSAAFPDNSFIQAVPGRTGSGMFLVSGTGDDTSYVKIGAGSTAFSAPGVTINKSGTASSAYTGGTMIVFSKFSCPLTSLPHFLSRVALLSSRVSFLPQSNQLVTFSELKRSPEAIIQSSAGVSPISSSSLQQTFITCSRHLNIMSEFAIL